MSRAQSGIDGSPCALRLAQLDAVLHAHQRLWRPQPYKQMQPEWCMRHPLLAADLLALGDAEVDALNDDAPALIDFVGRSVPSARRLAGLISLQAAEASPLAPADPHAVREIPGRKAAQIEAFAAALGAPRAPVTEWCAGKGHLGRRIASHSGVAVSSLEIDARLCDAGRALAQRAGIATQGFVTVDVLSPFVHGRLRGSHAVGLHACGDLHLALLLAAAGEGAAALHLAPCCFHKTADPSRACLSGEGSIALSHDDLRLAVSDSVTAAPREIRAGRLEAAWILGLRALIGVDRLSMRPPAMRPGRAAGRGSFRQFCEQAASLRGVALGSGIDWQHAEAQAHRLEHRVRRLSLVRRAFRRAIELWLVCDRARFLEQRGYRVSVSEFCERTLTPRNILIAAVRG